MTCKLASWVATVHASSSAVENHTVGHVILLADWNQTEEGPHLVVTEEKHDFSVWLRTAASYIMTCLFRNDGWEATFNGSSLGGKSHRLARAI